MEGQHGNKQFVEQPLVRHHDIKCVLSGGVFNLWLGSYVFQDKLGLDYVFHNMAITDFLMFLFHFN